MNDVQYRFTQSGREALAIGDYLTELANDAASDGVVTTQGIMGLKLELTPIEAERILSVLLRSGYIEPYSAPKMQYELPMLGG